MVSERDAVKLIVLILAIVLFVPLVMMLLAWPMSGMWDGGHMWDGGGMGWVAVASWAVIMLVLLGAVLLLFWVLRPAAGATDDPALEEVRLAYARGELSDEEYTERIDRLGQDE